MTRILAIDYGTKRVGLAVTDPLQIIASSLATVDAKEVIQYLKNYCKQELVARFVVGKPLQMNGSPSESTAAIEKFISLLAQEFPNIPIDRVDERLTSRMATQTLLDMGLKKKDRRNKGNVDQVAAVLILQTWLYSRA